MSGNGPKVVLREEPQRLTLPGDQQFACPSCGLLCITNSRTRSVVHQKPTCKRWAEAIETPAATSQFLVEAGQVTRIPEPTQH